MKKNYTSKKYLLIVMCLTITFLMSSGCSEKKKIEPVSQEDVKNKRNESGTVDTVNTIQNAIENNTNEIERARHKKIRDTSDLFAKNIEEFQDEKYSADSFIYNVTNGYIDIKDVHILLDKYDEDDIIKIVDIICDNIVIPHHHLANIIYTKSRCLRQKDKYQECIDMCTNYANIMRNTSPYGVSLLMSYAGYSASKAGFNNNDVAKYYSIARNYSDPRIYEETNNERFGETSSKLALFLFKMKKYDEVIELYKDTIPNLKNESSWKRPGSSLHYFYETSIVKSKNQGGE